VYEFGATLASRSRFCTGFPSGSVTCQGMIERVRLSRSFTIRSEILLELDAGVL
jgi:hypothetical protein